MERILTNKQMRDADEFTMQNLGISHDELVFRAGSAVVDVINKRFLGGRVLVCIGVGNNGADGEVIAKLLSKKHGFTVSTVNVKNGIFKVFDNKFDIIVDCIFGTGLNRTVEGNFKKAIELINNSGAFVIACDIPSGLSGDTGLPMGIAVKANLTIAIQEFKLGHFLNDGKDYCGEVIAKDIGISIWGEDYVTRISKHTVAKYIEKRASNVHKGLFGKTCVLGGSKNFPGSVLISANAICALKMGVGYCNLAIPQSLTSVYLPNCPECTVTPIKDNNGKITFDEVSLKELLKYNSIAVGMGIGVDEENYKSICYLLANYTGRLLIDADGLNCLAKYGVNVIKEKKCQLVLTPHIGEFARLCDKTTQEVMANILELAKNFAKEYRVVLIVKSATSVITDGEQVVLNTTGCSGMAKGGSGDLLSGLTVGLLAQEKDFFETCCVAPYLFGKTGENAQNLQNEYTLTASDIISALPTTINSLR